MRLDSRKIAEKDPLSRPPPDFVMCGSCSECVRDSINDKVGRAVAEGSTAFAYHAFTLTYDPRYCIDAAGLDHSKVACKRDVQLFVKRLRAAGYPCRYFYVFEFGGKRQRCHAHMIIYWTSPKVPFLYVGKDKWMFEFWPHGYTYVKPGAGETVRYAIKYQSKSFSDGGGLPVVFGMSKKPPLGAQFFKNEAARWVESGLAPTYMTYSLRRVVCRTGSSGSSGFSGSLLRFSRPNLIGSGSCAIPIGLSLDPIGW